MEPTWRDLFEFIMDKIEKEGSSFLDNELVIEMQSPDHVNRSFKKIMDSEGWEYTAPAWKFGDKIQVNTTTFKDKKIVSLNINY